MAPQQHARYHSLGEGYGHARSALGPERGAETQRPHRYGTIDLQQIRDDGKKAQTLAEFGIWKHRQNQADSDTHSLHGTSPAAQHSLKQIASLHGATEGNNALGANSSWSAQVQPFGDGHGHTDTTPGPVKLKEHCSQISATQERHWQILNQERAAANLGPRSHPAGNSLAQQKPEKDKVTNHTQDAPTTDKINHNTVVTHVGPLAEGCGKLAEFLAQTPWEEKRTGLGFAQLDVEQHLNSHNHICHRVMQMLEDLPIEAIHTTEATKLQRLHSAIQLSCIREWPKVFLQPEASTLEFNLVISEIAEFETKRLGFLHMVRKTILSVYDTLTNPDRIEPKNCLPKLLPLLGTQLALT